MSEPTTYNNMFDTQGHLTDNGIQAFVSGKLSDKISAKVEQHIANCDMCADAVEGASILQSENILQTSLERISDKIDERVSPKGRMIPLWNRYLSAAAVLLVLFGLVFVTNQYVLNNGNDELAEKVKGTTDEEETGNTGTEEAYTESADETINNDLGNDVTDHDVRSETLNETPSPKSNYSDQPLINDLIEDNAPTVEQPDLEAPEPEANTFNRQQDNAIVNGNVNTNNGEFDIADDELADIEVVNTSKQRSNVDKEIQQEEGVKFESTSAAPSNIGYAPDSYTGGNTDTTLTEYLSNFRLSDSLSQNYVSGSVLVEIDLNKKGSIKRVTILQGLSPAIDKEVESYIMLTPPSATMQYLHNGGTLPIKATVSVP